MDTNLCNHSFFETLLLRILSLKSVGELRGNSYTKFLSLDISKSVLLMANNAKLRCRGIFRAHSNIYDGALWRK